MEPTPPPLPKADAPTLLTVDDEPSVLNALRRLFRTQGYRTLQAGSGAEALALMEQHTPDLILSDMRMPEMNGAQFLELARLRCPQATRVLLTGYADIAATVAAINRGEIHRYIAKPWDDQDLLLLVRDALARRQLEQQNAELQALTQRQNAELQEANRTLEARVATRTAELDQLNGMLEATFADLEQTFTLSVKVFAGLLEQREGSAGHARRVAALAHDTARRLGLRERDLRDVYLGALLHDIGKIGFPDSLLGRPVSTYSVSEMARYRRHPLDGEMVLMPLTGLRAAARVVREHHERFDGRGYPDQLAGEAIFIGARIVAAASDHDGLLHGHLAQDGGEPERARRWLREHAGTLYDPRVVAVMLDAITDAELRAGEGRRIDVRDLRPGMTLARDLLSPTGAILLAAGYVFDARIITQVQGFAQRESLRLTLQVQNEPDLLAELGVIDQRAPNGMAA